MRALCTAASAVLMMALPGLLRSQTPPPNGAQAGDDRIRAAETALEHNDLKTAAGLLGKLAEERPHDARVFYDLGYADEGLGDEPGAQKAYAAAIAADPSDSEAHVALGLLLAREGSGTRAETVAQLRAGADMAGAPAEIRAHALRALASLEETKDPAKASDDLLQAIRLTHETEPDMVQSADLALAAGDLADAEKAYRRARELQPDDVSAATGLAEVLKRNKQLPEADAVLSATLKAHPDDPRVMSALAVLKASENKPAEAVALLEPLVSPGVATRNPALTRELAHLYVLANELAKAEALYGELVAADPQNPALLDDYGDVLVREAKFGPAETMLQRAVANRGAWPQPSDWADAAGHLAFAASRNHDPQVTLQALAARATVLPNSPATLFLEATAKDSLHQTRYAIQAYQAFLAVANGKFPDEEFEARHRLVALERSK